MYVVDRPPSPVRSPSGFLRHLWPGLRRNPWFGLDGGGDHSPPGSRRIQDDGRQASTEKFFILFETTYPPLTLPGSYLIC